MQMLSPIAPHIAEELWRAAGSSRHDHVRAVAEYDEAWTVDQEVEIVVQVNGKIVDRISHPGRPGRSGNEGGGAVAR